MSWAILALLVLSIAWCLVDQYRVRRNLRRFLTRPCTGSRWRRQFPEANKAAIRAFLDVFLNAFSFSTRRRFAFYPDDRVLDVYRALYPPPSLADSMELELLFIQLKERYRDSQFDWREEMTLGELFAATRPPESN